jgi:hypothetical protein
MPRPLGDSPKRGAHRFRRGPRLHRPLSASRRSADKCGVCDEPAVKTVLIGFGGVMLLKEVCQGHLQELLEGARGWP